MNLFISFLHPALQEIDDNSDPETRARLIRQYCGDHSKCYIMASNILTILSTDVFQGCDWKTVLEQNGNQAKGAWPNSPTYVMKQSTIWI